MTATSSTGLSYQWQFNGADIAGATGATLTLSGVTGANDGTYAVVVSDAAGRIASTATASLLVRVPFNEWQAGHFTTGQLAIPAISGATGSANGSGFTNLLAYFADLNPTRPLNLADFAALPVSGRETVSGVQYLTLTYRQNARALNLGVNVQVSTTLLSNDWQTVTPDVLLSLAPDASTGDPRFEAKVNVTGKPKEFIRLQLTEP